MKELEEKILVSGVIQDNKILNVDSFVNHQIDVRMLDKVCFDIAQKFDYCDKIITIESIGIPFAVTVSRFMGKVPVVFAKRTKDEPNKDCSYVSEIYSKTHFSSQYASISKEYISKGEHCLIIDAFLSSGNSCLGLVDLINQADAKVVGVGVVVDKEYEGGRKKLEEKNIKVYSSACVKEIKDNKIIFEERE